MILITIDDGGGNKVLICAPLPEERKKNTKSMQKQNNDKET